MQNSGKEIFFDKFEIIDCLKKDDHAAVYLANHIYLSKKIILKVLNTKNLPDNSLLERFKREAKILAKIDNRNIIRVLDFGTHDEKFYISFEYFVSDNLRKWISKNTLTNPEKKELVIQLFRGIDHAHRNNIIHRDIKPENIFVSETLDLKLGDFGLALGVNENFVTSQFSILGTPCYMSPEQILGEKLSPLSDLFSAGIVVFELYTGTNLFLGKDVNETINKIINFDETVNLEVPEAIPYEIRTLITGLLKKDIGSRIKTAENVLEILGGVEISSASPVIVNKNKLPGKSGSKNSIVNKKTVLMSVLLVLVIVLSLAVYNYNLKRQFNEFRSAYPNVKDTIIIYRADTASRQNKKTDEEQSKENNKAELNTNEPKDLAKKETSVPEVKKASAAQAEKREGSLFVVCHPWANVYVDSVKVETTPLKSGIGLKEGEHLVQLIHPNYPVYTKRVYIAAFNQEVIKINLDTLFGYLDCKVLPWGEVFVDGKLVGQTPLQSPIRLFPGEHNVVLKNSAYNQSVYTVKIGQNQTYILKHTFKNLN